MLLHLISKVYTSPCSHQTCLENPLSVCDVRFFKITEFQNGVDMCVTPAAITLLTFWQIIVAFGTPCFSAQPFPLTCAFPCLPHLLTVFKGDGHVLGWFCFFGLCSGKTKKRTIFLVFFSLFLCFFVFVVWKPYFLNFRTININDINIIVLRLYLYILTFN